MTERQKPSARKIARRKPIRQKESDATATTPHNDAQYQRFREFLADQDADNDADKFDEAFKRIVMPKQK